MAEHETTTENRIKTKTKENVGYWRFSEFRKWFTTNPPVLRCFFFGYVKFVLLNRCGNILILYTYWQSSDWIL